MIFRDNLLEAKWEEREEHLEPRNLEIDLEVLRWELGTWAFYPFTFGNLGAVSFWCPNMLSTGQIQIKNNTLKNIKY